MAAPATKTGLDIEGTWLLNRTLSDDFDGIFALQGMSWLVRKILKLATMRLRMSQTHPSSSSSSSSSSDSSTSSVSTIYQKQTIHPGGFDSEDVFVLDGAEREFKIPIFGEVVTRYKYTAIDELDDGIDEGLKGRLRAAGSVQTIQEICRSKNAGWSSTLTWGFEEVDGVRRFTQNSVTEKDGKRLTGRLVYDFEGE